jgi:hypothetical protein
MVESERQVQMQAQAVKSMKERSEACVVKLRSRLRLFAPSVPFQTAAPRYCRCRVEKNRATPDALRETEALEHR